MHIPIKFGIELEMGNYDAGNYYAELGIFLSKVTSLPFTFYDPTLHKSKKNYSLGEDGSGCAELRTPIYKNIKQLQKLKIIINYLSKFFEIYKFNGMHIHISTDKKYKLNYQKFQKDIWRTFSKNIWPRRKIFCRNFSLTFSGYNNLAIKGCVHKVNGNHAEVRIFNSTFNFALIEKRVKQVIDLYQKNVILTEKTSVRIGKNK